MSSSTGCLVAACLAATACTPAISEQAQQLSENLVAMSHESFNNGDLGDALRKGLQAVETDPTSADATYMVGFVYAARGDYVEAERYLKKTLELDTTYTDARNLLGQIYDNQGRYQDAIAILEQAAADLLYPTPHLVQGNLGQAYLLAGDYDKAVEWLLRSVREEPRFCVGFYRLGDALVHRGDDASAEQALVSAVTVDDPACQRLQQAWRMLGEVRLRLGHEGPAAEAFGTCAQIDERTTDGTACAAALARLPASGGTPAPPPPAP